MTDVPAPPSLRPSPHRWSAADLAVLVVAIGLLTLQVVVARSDTGENLDEAIDGVAVALFGLASIGALAAMRFPATGALAALAGTLAWYQIGYSSSLVNIPHLLAFFFLGLSGDRRRQIPVGLTAAALTLASMRLLNSETASTVIAALGWTIAAVLLGEAVCSRRALLSEYAARAVRAESERDAEAQRRVAQARLEIARDLHDVLAHTVSFMTLQANVGADALARGTGGVQPALMAIRKAGSDAVREVESLITMLRGADNTPIAPVPSLARIADLLDAPRAAGIDVTANVNAAVDQVSDLTQLTAYRIVQESVSNVIRHSAARRILIDLRDDGPHLVIEIRNDGADGESATQIAGHGIIGMRERAESIGGQFAAGPQPPDNWVVTARLPRRSAATP